MRSSVLQVDNGCSWSPARPRFSLIFVKKTIRLARIQWRSPDGPSEGGHDYRESRRLIGQSVINMHDNELLLSSYLLEPNYPLLATPGVRAGGSVSDAPRTRPVWFKR